MTLTRIESTRGTTQGRRVLASLLVLVTVYSCSGGTPTGRMYASRATVYGYVTAADGSPAVGVNVRSWAHPDTCQTDDAFAFASPQPTYVQTDVEGRYRQGLISSSFPFTGCVSLELIAAGTRDQVLATVPGGTVRFTAANPEGRYDSVRVDVRLP